MHIFKDTNAEERTDEEILALSVENPRYFEVLVARYEDAFLRKAMKVLGKREDAEDVVQDTFTKIYLNASRFQVKEGASFKSWGYKILMNTAFTAYQKKKKDWNATAPLEPEFYEMLPDKESRQFENHVTEDFIVSVFSQMPRALSRVLTLQFLDGLNQSEIAEEEGLSVSAVKTRVHRAKKEFKRIVFRTESL